MRYEFLGFGGHTAESYVISLLAQRVPDTTNVRAYLSAFHGG